MFEGTCVFKETARKKQFVEGTLLLTDTHSGLSPSSCIQRVATPTPWGSGHGCSPSPAPPAPPPSRRSAPRSCAPHPKGSQRPRGGFTQRGEGEGEAEAVCWFLEWEEPAVDVSLPVGFDGVLYRGCASCNSAFMGVMVVLRCRNKTVSLAG